MQRIYGICISCTFLVPAPLRKDYIMIDLE